MKKQALLTFVVLFLGITLFAQDFQAPKKGAKLYVENSIIDVEVNNETSFDVWLVRSKVARKAKFEAPKVLSPKGMEFEVIADAEDKNHFTVKLTASSIEEGTYSATLTGKRSGVHTVTGTLLTINVVNGQVVASKDGK